ncbi:MAG: hypothetical protein Fur0041_18460 [Bacteroidia bacterium]
MNINKVIATLIALFILLVPGRILYMSEFRIVSGASDIFLFLTCVIGFFAIFYIGTNEPFGKKEEVADLDYAREKSRQSKAA